MKPPLSRRPDQAKAHGKLGISIVWLPINKPNKWPLPSSVAAHPTIAPRPSTRKTYKSSWLVFKHHLQVVRPKMIRINRDISPVHILATTHQHPMFWMNNRCPGSAVSKARCPVPRQCAYYRRSLRFSNRLPCGWFSGYGRLLSSLPDRSLCDLYIDDSYYRPADVES